MAAPNGEQNLFTDFFSRFGAKGTSIMHINPNIALRSTKTSHPRLAAPASPVDRPRAGPSRSTEPAAPPPYTDEVTGILQALKDNILALHLAHTGQAPASPARMAQLEASIRTGMARVAQIHPDPRVRAEYRDKLSKLDSPGDDGEKGDVLTDIATGLGVILSTPFVLVGGVLLLGGSIIEGTGQLLKGVGNFLASPLARESKK